MSYNHGAVTIQAGMYANFIGTHWWNMQEASFCYNKDQAPVLDINHDILFREGLDYQRETTFTPRLLCIDLKGNFKGLRGNLYDEPSETEFSDGFRSISDGFGLIGFCENEKRFATCLPKHFCEHSSQASHSDTWNGHPDVKPFPAADPGSVKGSVDQGTQQSSSVVEIYNPEKVNVEAASSCGRSSTDICWCHFRHDLPEPKPQLAPHCWSEFVNTCLHPKSQCIIDEHSLNYSSNSPLDVYGAGVHMYSCEDARSNIEDRIRWYVEECDYLQGFQVLVDAYNGFAGVADCILQHVDDEYQKKATICFPVFQNSHPLHSQDTMKKMQIFRLYSTLLSFNTFNSYCSIFSPLTVNKDLLSFETPYTFFPYAHLNPQLLYHSSAILAGAVECVTAPYRIKAMQFQMSDIVKSVVLFDRKLVSTNICFPFPVSASVPFKNLINGDLKPGLTPCPLTPLSNPLHHKILSQFAVLRGVPASMLHCTRTSVCGKVSTEDLLSRYVQKYCPTSVLSMSVFDEKCKVTPPFPNFLCFRLNSNGYISDHERPHNSGVKNIPVASFLCNSSGASDLLCKLINQAEKLNLKSCSKHEDHFVEGDDFSEAIQNLLCLKDCYGHDYS